MSVHHKIQKNLEFQKKNEKQNEIVLLILEEKAAVFTAEWKIVIIIGRLWQTALFYGH